MLRRRYAAWATLAGSSLLSMTTGAATAAEPPLYQLPATPEGERSLTVRLRLDANARLVYQDTQGNVVTFVRFMELFRTEQSLSMRKNDADKSVVLQITRKQTAEERRAEEEKRLAAIKLKPGQPLFDFELQSLDGAAINKQSLAGRYSLISFFFEACAPCIVEVPALNKFRELHPELNLVALTYDPQDKAQRFKQRHKLAWPIAYEGRDFNKQLGVSIYPSFALIDPQGRFLGYRVLGGRLDDDEIAGRAEHAALAAWVKTLMPAAAR